MNPDGTWHITHIHWRNDFVNQSGYKGSFTRGETKGQPTPQLADFPGQQTCVNIDGKLENDSQGTYCKSADTFNGKPIWDRTKNNTMFAFINSDGRWHITGTRWRKEFVNQNGNKGSFTHGQTRRQATPQLARFPGQTQVCVYIESENAMNEGEYCLSQEFFWSTNTWDRTDHQRFAFYDGVIVAGTLALVNYYTHTIGGSRKVRI